MSSPTIKQRVLSIAAGTVLVLLATQVSAEDSEDKRISRSVTFSKTAELDTTAKDILIEQAAAEEFSALISQGFRQESTVMAAHIITTEHSSVDDVYIYDVSTDLISDFDHDGFYHRYSVAIDADTIFHTSYIYAELYLSYEGGPWNYYASSDNYLIHSDSEMDAFIIETELADGYPTGYYDLRIEIYDVETGAWLSSYGPYDDASLTALPLEDSYDDSIDNIGWYPVETEIVVASHGGSMSWLMMPLSILILINRRFAMNPGYYNSGKLD
jgi:hypothetical protein